MFLPENIDLSQSEKYILSIRIAPSGFSFCIYSSTDKANFHFQDIELSNNLTLIENIKKTFFEVNFFSHPFKKTIVTIVGTRYTLVPNAFYDKNKAKLLFNFNVNDKYGKIITNEQSETDSSVIFDLDEDTFSFLQRNLWNPSFYSHTTHIIKFATQQNKNNKNGGDKTCLVDFHDEWLTIICLDKNNRLLSANTFDNKNNFDALYYIVNVWENLPLNQNSDTLFLSGATQRNRETIDTLKKLIKNVKEIELKTKSEISNNNLQNIPTEIILQLCD